MSPTTVRQDAEGRPGARGRATPRSANRGTQHPRKGRSRHTALDDTRSNAFIAFDNNVITRFDQMQRKSGLNRRSRLAAIAALVLVAISLLSTCDPSAEVNHPNLTAAFGISPGGAFLFLPDDEIARELDTYRKMGATWIRLDIPWWIVEEVQGEDHWALVDNVVKASTARGFEILGILAYTPRWARSGLGDYHRPPTNSADFARFAGTAAAHYAGTVAAFEVWNEPNTSEFWAPATDPAAYVRLLKLTYASIKAVDPSLTVVAGAMGTAEDSSTSLSPVSFARAMYAHGAKGYFDALSVHPYSRPALVSDNSSADPTAFSQVTLLHSLMAEHGDSKKRIWLSEFGAPTGTSPDGAVTVKEQADILVDGFRRARTWAYAGPLFIFSGRDRGVDRSEREQNFGLLRLDFSEKPSAVALRDLF